MDLKERLLLEKEAEEGKMSALDRIIARTENSISAISSKIQKSEVVAGISGAIGCVSAFLLESSDKFNSEVAKNGVDFMSTPAGEVMLGLTIGGLAVAGGAMLYRHFQNEKLDDVTTVYADQLGDHSDCINNIAEIDKGLAQIERNEAFFKNYEAMSKDFEEDNIESCPEE